MKRRHPQFDARDSLLDAHADSTLDLHGMGADDARQVLTRFLEQCSRRHERHVHIITGKGRGSAKGAVLKPLVRGMLTGTLSALVGDWSMDATGGGYVVRLR